MSHKQVADHYTVTDLGDRILSALKTAGKDLNALTVDDLAPVDAFHIRGRGATEELAGWADVQPHHTVLDVGCGLGGTSRYLAATTGCTVIGVDLTEEYCRVAGMLSARVGLADRTSFHTGSALDLPFEDDRFDIVWTEHVQMNIADKLGFYRELSRVIKPGGQLAFHDIFAGDGGVPHFPVPWASDASISHLVSIDDLKAILAELRLSPLRWEDKTDASIDFFEEVRRRLQAEARPPVGLHLLMGDSAPTRFANVLRNLQENRIRVVQAVMRQSVT